MRASCVVVIIALVLGLSGSAWADSLYVSSFNNNAVYKIDASTGNLQQTISATNMLVSPSGLALSPDGSRLYVSGTNSSNADVYVFNTTSGALVDQYLSSLTGGRGLALSSDGSTLYQSGVGSDTIELYNTATGVGSFGTNLVSNPQGLALSSDGNTLFVANTGANNVREFAVHAGGTNATLSAPGSFYSPSDVVLSPNGLTLYVSTFGDGGAGTDHQILRYDASTGNYIGSWTVTGPAGDLYGMAITPDGSMLYVADTFNSLLYTVNTATGASSEFSTNAPLNGPAFILYVPTVVPEPSSLALMGLGAFGLAASAWSRRGRPVPGRADATKSRKAGSRPSSVE